MSAAPRRPPARGGFTLFELILALIAITLIAAVSTWAYFTRPEVTLDNAASLLARDMRIAQSRAVLLRHPVELVFAPGGDGYRIVDGGDDAAGPHPAFERIDRRYSRDAVFEGVRILAYGLAAEGRIRFAGDGTELPGGRLLLTYRSETRTLEVEHGTGKILLTDTGTGTGSGGQSSGP